MFLPRICLLSVALVVGAAACGGGVPVASPPAPVDSVHVVAGSDEVDPAVVARVRMLVDRELPQLRQLFEGRPLAPFTVTVHAARASMPAALLAMLHPDSPGFAMLGMHQIHLVWGEMRRTGSDPRGVVVHEMTHELLDQFVAPNGRLLPRWFHEGLAQHVAGDTYLQAREDDLVWRVGARSLFAFGELDDHFPADSDALRTAYAQSYSYVSWLVRRYGMPTMLRVARNTDHRTSFEHALVGATGESTLRLEDGWRDHLLYGSGASWRVALQNCFGLLMIAALPVLVLALIRRLAAEQRAAQRIAANERAAALARAAAEAAEAELRAAAEAAAASGFGSAPGPVPGPAPEPDEPPVR